ncbi:MAG: hypothetical protein GY722_24060 [bacterium]|nr:hypothetical protein [bacterium]
MQLDERASRRLCFLFLLLGCTADGPQEADNSSPNSNVAPKTFDQLYAELEEYRETPPVSISSGIDDHNDCEAFREIVRRGDEFLPQIVEKIEEGDFFLNQAMEQITGIDIREIFPDEPTLGEQDASRLWLRWWNRRALLSEAEESSTSSAK